jgi:hypothetical protein
VLKTSKEERFCLLLVIKPCFDYLDAGVSRCIAMFRHVCREALNVNKGINTNNMQTEILEEKN